jgi:hypothetical protein
MRALPARNYRRIPFAINNFVIPKQSGTRLALARQQMIAKISTLVTASAATFNALGEGNYDPYQRAL